MKKQKGSIIVFALIVLSFILIAAFSIAAVTLVERRSTGASVNSSTAFQNADKGMEEFLQQIYKDLNQNDALGEVGVAMNHLYGSGYTCVPGSGLNPARMGDDDTEFIISAYREDVDPDDPAGWRSTKLKPIIDCNDVLADVSRFKIVGDYNNTKRAVFVKLRDSLTRGLMAHWAFEDRAQIARILTEPKERISLMAQDSSKQNHTMTLCRLAVLTEPIPPSTTVLPEDPADSGDIPIGVSIETDGPPVTQVIDEFDACEAINPGYPHDFSAPANVAMSPHRGYGDDSDPEYNDDGAWVQGIVEEQPDNLNPIGDDSSSEALYFNGETYLAMYTEASCDPDVTNCVDDVDDKLQNIKEGLSVSMWINAADTGGRNQYVIFREDSSSERFFMYLDRKDIIFRVGDTQVQTPGTAIGDDDTWYHVVGMWRGGGNKSMTIFVNGELKRNINSGLTSFIAPDSPLYIGSNDSGNNFTGDIDDVRIWNRALTQDEVCRLCWEAGTDAQAICDSDCNPLASP